MAKTKTLSIECPGCQQRVEMKVYESFHLSEDQALRVDLLNGDLNHFHCNHCGADFPLPQPLLYHDNLRRLMVYHLPQQEALDLSQRPEITDMYTGLQKNGYVFRLVRNYNDLREKIFAAEQGLDDYTLELYKFILKMKLEAKDKIAAEHIYFDAAECTPFIYGSVQDQRGNLVSELLTQNPMPHFVILAGQKLLQATFDAGMYAMVTQQFTPQLRLAWAAESQRKDWPIVDEAWAREIIQKL